MAFAPTGEQVAIYDAVSYGDPLTIEAGAGAGKTTTLRGIADLMMRKGRSGLYLAYNRKIKDEAVATFPRNTICKTGHGLAWSREYANRMEAVGYVKPTAVAAILGLRSPIRFRDDAPPMKVDKIARLALETVTRFCYSADVEITEEHVPTVPGIESDAQREHLATVLVPLARKAWVEISNLRGSKLKFDFDHYLKCFQLDIATGRKPAPRADFVLFDEAQDSNPAVLAIIDAMVAAGTQIIAVGDRAQAIYRFRGAVNAMDHYPGNRAMLSKSFRFGPAIATEANKYLDVLDLSPLRVFGHDPVPSRIGDLSETVPDAILCRSNGGMMAEIMTLRELDDPTIRIAVAGGSKDIKMMAESALSLQDGRGADHPDLIAFTDWADLQLAVEEDASLSSLRRFVKMVDRWGPWPLIFAVKDLVDEHRGRPTVTVATAHKCKGLEWPRVKVSFDFKAPDSDDDGWCGEIDPDEAQLAYVTVTRAKTVLDRGSLDYIDNFAPMPLPRIGTEPIPERVAVAG